MFALSIMDLKRAMAINVRRERHARKLTKRNWRIGLRFVSRYGGAIEREAVSASVTVLGRLARPFASIRAS